MRHGDGMCMGYHGWREGDFGEHPIAGMRAEPGACSRRRGVIGLWDFQLTGVSPLRSLIVSRDTPSGSRVTRATESKASAKSPLKAHNPLLPCLASLAG